MVAARNQSYGEQRQSSLGLEWEYPLSEKQISSLHERGWTLLPGFISKTTAEAIRAALAGLKERRPLKPTDSAYVKDPNPKSNRKQESVAQQSPFFRQIATSRRIGGTAARLMRLPEVLFTQDMSFFKPPQGGAPTYFHQDLPYFPFDRKGSISIWIALVDMSESMGPLQYLDNSHYEGPLGRTGEFDVRKLYPHLYNNKIGGGNALQSGDAQVHLDLTIHGADSNVSDTTREAYTLRYIRPDTIYTGTGHPHYDNFDKLKIGRTFGESGEFDRVGPEGPIDLVTVPEHTT